MAKERRGGDPRSDEERLREHFGADWQKHAVSELPPRRTGLRTGRAAGTTTSSWWKGPVLGGGIGALLGLIIGSIAGRD